jgi:hypothetical protein
VANPKAPVIRVTVFEDGTFLIAAHPEHRDEVARSLRILANAFEGGAEYLVQDM